MDWTTLAATGLGAFIGVVSTVVADKSRYRREAADRDREDQKVTFAHCLVSFRQAHEAMRAAVISHDRQASTHFPTLILDAYRSAGADEAREAMMLVAPDEVLSAVDAAYHTLREIRAALIAGHGLDSSQYDEARQLHGDATRNARSVMRSHLKAKRSDR